MKKGVFGTGTCPTQYDSKDQLLNPITRYQCVSAKKFDSFYELDEADE